MTHTSQSIPLSPSQKVMSVLNPVVSLLDGLRLSDTSDQQVVSEIKSKLASIGGIPVSEDLNKPPAPSDSQTSQNDADTPAGRFLRGAKTSAIKLLPPEMTEQHMADAQLMNPFGSSCVSNASSSSIEGDEDETTRATMCGSVFDSLLDKISSFWTKPTEDMSSDGRPTQALLEDMSPQVLSTRNAKIVQRIPFPM